MPLEHERAAARLLRNLEHVATESLNVFVAFIGFFFSPKLILNLLSIYFQTKQQRTDQQIETNHQTNQQGIQANQQGIQANQQGIQASQGDIQENQGKIQHLKVRYFVSSSLCMTQKSMYVLMLLLIRK